MKVFCLAALLLSSTAALAGSLEDAYLATRDHDIAALTTLQNAKDTTASDAQNNMDLKNLEAKLKAIVGPFTGAGFPAEGKINLGSLSSYDEGFGALDGLVYGEGDKSVVVTTDGLFDTWLIGHREWSKGNGPLAAADAVKTEQFYTQALSADAAVVAFAEIPVAAPPGARFAHAILSGRTQDLMPDAPTEIFVALEHGGRVFIVNEKLATPIKPIAACDAAKAAYTKKAEAADRSAGTDSRKKRMLMDRADRLRAEGDATFRACFRDKVKGEPVFKAATEQVAAIVAAMTRP